MSTGPGPAPAAAFSIVEAAAGTAAVGAAAAGAAARMTQAIRAGTRGAGRLAALITATTPGTEAALRPMEAPTGMVAGAGGDGAISRAAAALATGAPGVRSGSIGHVNDAVPRELCYAVAL